MQRLLLAAAVVLFGLPQGSAETAPPPVVERVTTIAPFPRGLELLDGKLYVLCRGRMRQAGGVSAEVSDQAGTIYVVDPNVAEPIDHKLSDRIRRNGAVFALPTEPPFKLWNRTAEPPESDRQTDRPYCTLRYHNATQSFYVCCFSGVDKPKGAWPEQSFSKNLTDALLRYDLRTRKWYEVERHEIEAGGTYPHHDPRHFPPPHGWLNGPDNCLVVGNHLYAVAKDNSLIVRYDLSALVEDPEAGPPPSEVVLNAQVYVRDVGMEHFYGHSALAVHSEYLYVGCRTSSVVFRLPIDDDGLPQQPIIVELIARFQPYNPMTGISAELTDMAFDSKGRLYVLSAEPARIFRFAPNPERVYDARDPDAEPWLDLAAAVGNSGTKSENILIDDQDGLFVTSGDAYGSGSSTGGAVYRIRIPD